MGKKDIITKEYMEDTEVFADVFNHMIYEEKSLVLVAVRVMEEMTGKSSNMSTGYQKSPHFSGD